MSPQFDASKPLRVRIHLLESDEVLRQWIRGNRHEVMRAREHQVICENSRYADAIAARWMNRGNGRGCWQEHYEVK